MKNIVDNIGIILDNANKNNDNVIDNILITKIENNIFEYLYEKESSSLLSKNHLKSIVSNHIAFFKNIFFLNDPKLIIEHYLWEIYTFKNIGLEKIFFKDLLSNVLKELSHSNKTYFSHLISIYKVLIENYELLYGEAKELNACKIVPSNKQTFKKFLDAILKPDIDEALNISNEFINNAEDIKVFWEQIILSSLYTIGSLWANGKISVGEEHTATSICQRVMSIHYEKILNNYPFKKKILVAVSTNELHEIGAQMLADLLEFNQYDTYFFGSKSSTDKIIETINNEKIEDILISTTLASNLNETKEMIKEIKSNISLETYKIYVGGQAFNNIENKIELVDADYYVLNYDDLIKILKG